MSEEKYVKLTVMEFCLVFHDSHINCYSSL